MHSMHINKLLVVAVMASCLCVAQTSSKEAAPVSSSKYRVASVLAVKVHQPISDEDAKITRYDVTVRVEDVDYVVLYTPPEGTDVVEYSLGRDGLVLVGRDSIKWHDSFGRPREARILQRRNVPPKAKK